MTVLLIIAGLAFGLSVNASITAYQAKKLAAARPRGDGGCHEGKDHDWANWSAPDPIKRREPIGLNLPSGTLETIERDVFVQTRVCLRCNLQQRALS